MKRQWWMLRILDGLATVADEILQASKYERDRGKG